MSNGGRSILSLTPLVDDAEADQPLELAVYDILLPCRRFTIDHKVAMLGSVSLTSEFMLRLVRSVEGIRETHAADFFGFDRREMSFVISEVEAHGYLERADGRLWLTKAGEALFRAGSQHPEIFEVEQRSERVGFDLIALAPQEFTPLDKFQVYLPELKLADPSLASSATDQMYSAFRKHYLETTNRRDQSSKRSLYSIDRIVAAERFSSPIRISVRSTGLHPSIAEPDLSNWRPENERDDRGAIVQAAAKFIETLEASRRPDDRASYQILSELAPEFLREFIRRDGLAIERYYREAFTRVGEVRSDRPTIPLLGSLFTRGNTGKFLEVAAYAVRPLVVQPAFAIWLTPQMGNWGATQLLPEILNQIKSNILRTPSEGEMDPKTIAMVAGKPAKYLEFAFDIVATSESPRSPPRLEILIIPGALVAATIAAPINTPTGTPVPLGLLSFDSAVVQRAQAYVGELIADYTFPPGLYQAVEMALDLEAAS
ncbi:MAG: hypothetical protein KDJ47_06615 [Hyphomicrobiaceae bacterium]|nr:hypothetical protein [Hyphomicrobiaceae bacterium]